MGNTALFGDPGYSPALSLKVTTGSHKWSRLTFRTMTGDGIPEAECPSHTVFQNVDHEDPRRCRFHPSRLSPRIHIFPLICLGCALPLLTLVGGDLAFFWQVVT